MNLVWFKMEQWSCSLLAGVMVFCLCIHTFQPVVFPHLNIVPSLSRQHISNLSSLAYLHYELPPSGHPPFRQQQVLRLLLLLGLLDLSQTTDWIHTLTVIWSRLGGKEETHNS